MPQVPGRNKDEVAAAQGLCVPTNSVEASWEITREIGELGEAQRREKSWAVVDPDQNSLQSGWKGKL